MTPALPAAHEAPLPGLCELHAHLGGCIDLDDVLAMIEGRAIDWSHYEACYRRAYGRDPGLLRLLADLAAGRPGARARLERLFTFGEEDAGDFDRFYAKFALIACASQANAVSLERGFSPAIEAECRALIQSVARRCRAEGVAHIELRASLPSRVAPDTRRAVYRATLEEMLACSDERCTLVFTPGLPRDAPLEALGVVLDLALGELGQALVGVDFSHIEEGNAPDAQRPVAGALGRFNARHPRRALALLYHVGESYRDKSLASAVRWVDQAATALGAHRLGHAIALGVHPDHHRLDPPRSETVAERRAQLAHDLALADELRAEGLALDPDELRRQLDGLRGKPDQDRVALAAEPPGHLIARQRVAIRRVRAAGAVVEVCPASNRRIAGLGDPAHHPVHRFHAEGLPFIVATDDPALLGTALAAEERWICQQLGLDRQATAALRRRAWASRSVVLAGR